MTVQSISYLLFVLLLWLLAWPLRSTRGRQLLLLVASYVFYASWGLGFLAVLIISSLMNYVSGSALRRRPTVVRLWFGVALNLLLLGLFKYLPPLVAMASPGAMADTLLQRIVMPVGISFWTFQALSYLCDTYREEQIDPSLLEFCLYMAFWPVVLSGPVCRLPEMLPQLRQPFAPAWDDVAIGARRVVMGLFMKLVLAQGLAAGLVPGEGVAAGFDQIPGGWGGIDVWLLAIGFGFQLFFDFAGYSHIVIGTARLFGVRLPENFNHPYFSTSPSAFWTRWHMSLSFWIRDYVFLPLATGRRELWWRHAALVFAMLLFGLWHGATATLLLWGMYHGCLLVAHRLVQQWGRRGRFTVPVRLGRVASWGVTFALISLGWVLFRAPDLSQALDMLGAVLSPASYLRLTLRPNFYIITSLVVSGYFAYSGLEALLARWRTHPVVRRAVWALSPSYYAAAILLVIAWSKQESLFIYFQF